MRLSERANDLLNKKLENYKLKHYTKELNTIDHTCVMKKQHTFRKKVFVIWVVHYKRGK